MVPPFAVQPIGWVRSARTDHEHTPLQAALNPDEVGEIHVDPAFADGLDGLEGFDFAHLLTWLRTPDEDPEPVALRQVPYLLRPTGRALGIFATRGPRRPNPLGLSLVRVLGVDAGVDGGVVRFSGVDLLDGTPVVDIKPWVARFDQPYGLDGPPRSGWFDAVDPALGTTPAHLPAPPD